jgi:uncharacterized phage protein (TIGR01671 family)
MMREIKFRGKSIDNEEWVYGSYQADVLCMGRHTIIYSDREGLYCEDEVDPETVGQFTGLLDKNGKEIYEGDVVANSGYLGIVEWSSEMLWFHVDFGDGDPDLLADLAEIEVIGNKYEHPHILGGERS